MRNCTKKFGSHYRTYHTRAFTLVECLAVTSIIALLLSILVPVMGKVRQQSIKILCQAKLKSWSVVCASYTTDNNNRFPLGIINYNLDVDTAHQALWVGGLKNYYQDHEMRRCPATIQTNTSDIAKGVWIYSKNLSRSLNPGDYGSYGINGWVDSITQGLNESTHSNSVDFWQRTDLAKNMDKIPVMLDAVAFFALPGQYDRPPKNLRSITAATSVSMPQIARFSIPRHPSGTVNSLFMDSSVRSVKTGQLCSLKWYKSYDTHFAR